MKLLFAKGLPHTERLSATRRKRLERGIWQQRFWEHAIRDNPDYSKHIDYCHWNPMKHGYVKQLIDWPYSTFHRYVRHGLCQRIERVPTNFRIKNLVKAINRYW